MADGLLASGLNYIDQQKQALAARLGLLMNNPQEFAAQLGSEARQRAGVGLLGEPKTAQDMASGAWINSPYGQQAMQAGSGFAGIVGKAPRSLPLDTHSGELTKYSKPLPAGELFRETNANRLMELFQGNLPYGPEITHFAEVPEMALGQGFNKGVMIKVNSEGLVGRPYFGKPALQQSFLDKAGEFEVKEQPSRLLNAINEVWVSPDAYKDLRKPQRFVFDRYLKTLEAKGVKVNKVDKLPNSSD
jgi:hypothetical protein